jgi:hypothetical protein
MTKKMILAFTIASTLQLAALPGLSPLQAAQVNIIIYHTFLGKERVPTDFTIDELGIHMDVLQKRGFKFVTMRDIAGGKLSGDNNIMVCIDDGNQTLYRAYREVLRPRGIRPLLAVYPNIIGRRKYALTWGQLRELADDGCEVAAHGFYHLHVNEKLYKKNKQHFHDEIHKSKKTLEEKLGKRVSVFVYPSGEKCERAEKEVRAAGYECAFTINWGTVLVPLAKNRNIFALPRFMLVKDNWKNVFARLERKSGTNGGGRPVKYVKKDFVRAQPRL